MSYSLFFFFSLMDYLSFFPFSPFFPFFDGVFKLIVSQSEQILSLPLLQMFGLESKPQEPQFSGCNHETVFTHTALSFKVSYETRSSGPTYFSIRVGYCYEPQDIRSEDNAQ